MANLINLKSAFNNILRNLSMIASIIEIQKSKLINNWFREFDQSEPTRQIKVSVYFHPVGYYLAPVNIYTHVHRKSIKVLLVELHWPDNDIWFAGVVHHAGCRVDSSSQLFLRFLINQWFPITITTLYHCYSVCITYKLLYMSQYQVSNIEYIWVM